MSPLHKSEKKLSLPVVFHTRPLTTRPYVSQTHLYAPLLLAAAAKSGGISHIALFRQAASGGTAELLHRAVGQPVS